MGPPQQPRPLVINWHGCNAHVPVVAYQEQVSKIEQAASDYLYYAITPVGSQDPFNQYGWNTYGIQCGKVGTDDFAFAQALLDYAGDSLMRRYVPGILHWIQHRRLSLLCSRL